MNWPAPSIVCIKAPWEVKPVHIHKDFLLTKAQDRYVGFTVDEAFDLIYFDAFGCRVQPELWSAKVFENMFKLLKNGGILVTYAAKGVVRRDYAGLWDFR